MKSLPNKSILPFTEEHEKFRQEFAAFLDTEVVPYYLVYEKNCMVDRELFKKMGERGFNCMWLDKKDGGKEADLLYAIIYGEELSCRGLNGVLTRLSSDVVCPYIYYHGTEEQKQKYLPKVVSGDIVLSICMSERDFGSDLAHIETTAVKDGDNYIVNGGKIFISNGMLADIAIVAVRTKQDEKAHRGISLLLIPTDSPGFERKLLNKIGLRSQDTAEYIFKDVVVPKENLLGEENKGFYYLMQHLQKERLMGAWGTLGMAEHSFELAIERVKERKLFGKTVGNFQSVQFELSKAAIDIETTRSFIEKLTLLYMAGEDVGAQVSMAKYISTEVAFRVSDLGVQLWGGHGILRENAIARQFGDTRLYRMMGGTSEVQLSIVTGALGLK